MRRTNRGAFTLAEILVAVAVFGALCLVVHSFMRFTTRSQGRLLRRGKLLDEGHLGLLVLVETLQRAKHVEEPAVGDAAARVTYTDGAGVSWVLALEGDVLVRKERFGSRSERIAGQIDALTVAREDTDLVAVRMVLQDGKATLALQTAVYLRGAHREVPRPLVSSGGM